MKRPAWVSKEADQEETSSMKVGFVGLGAMGVGMARNLAKAGHRLSVFNRTRSRAEELKQDGVGIAETPGEAASGADVIFTMLADDQAVEEVSFGPGKILETLKAGTVNISASTISVALSRRLALVHRDKRQHYLPAPV